MALPLPILPASRRFYEPVHIIDIAPGETVDGSWVPGERRERYIQGSLQAKSNRSLGIDPAGDAGQGSVELYTRENLSIYDPDIGGQTLVESEGLYWRVVSVQSWGSIAHRLYNYTCQRYMEVVDTEIEEQGS